MEECLNCNYMEKYKKIFTPRILIYCEGSSDKHFVNAIKTAYGNDSRFVIQSGSGGSPEEVIKKCINVNGEYDRYCVIDGIPKVSAVTKKLAKDKKITLVEISPFLECVILNILEKNSSHDKGYNKNTAKDKLKNLAKNNGGLEKLFSDSVTKAYLKDRKDFIANFSVILDLLEKYKRKAQK